MPRSRRLLLLVALALACTRAPVPVPADAGSTGTASTETTATETTSDPTTVDDGMTIAPWGLDYGWDLMTQCDPFAQDCPKYEKCVPVASTGGNWDANTCVPVLGDQAPGEPCISTGSAEATDDCDADGFCFNYDSEDHIGTCLAFCRGHADRPVCDSGTTCLIMNKGAVTLCFETCDPVLQDCNPEHGCFVANDQLACLRLADQIAEGEPCQFLNDCDVGLTCVLAESLESCADDKCCASFCDLEQPDCSFPATACVALFDPETAPPEYQHVGLCLAD